jgi:hypothetical protein
MHGDRLSRTGVSRPRRPPDCRDRDHVSPVSIAHGATESNIHADLHELLDALHHLARLLARQAASEIYRNSTGDITPAGGDPVR